MSTIGSTEPERQRSFDEFNKDMRNAFLRIQPDAEILEPEDMQDLLAVALQRLGEIFGDADLANLTKASPHHPAVSLYRSIESLTARGGKASWPNETVALKALWKVVMDLSTWTPRDAGEAVFDHLREDALRWIAPSLRDPERFEDVITELYFWGRLREAGFDVELIEEEGFPDLMLERDGKQHYFEVKRVRIGSSAQRKLKNLIGDANKKMRRADPGSSGSLLISIGRSPNRVGTDHRVPNDIVGHKKSAEATLRAGQNRGIAEAILVWDDLRLTGGFPTASLNTYTRRAVSVSHPAPDPGGGTELRPDDVAKTIVVPVFWNKPDQGPPPASERPQAPGIVDGDVEVTEMFRAKTELEDAFRAEQAFEVIAEPDHRADVELGPSKRIVLATRRQHGPGPDHTVVVFGAELGDDGLKLQAAWRLFGDDPPQHVLSADARRAFDECLRRYGLPVKIGSLRQRLIEVKVASASVPVTMPRTGGRVTAFDVMTRRESGLVEHRWVFCIDDDKYRAVSAAEGFGMKPREDTSASEAT